MSMSNGARPAFFGPSRRGNVLKYTPPSAALSAGQDTGQPKAASDTHDSSTASVRSLRGVGGNHLRCRHAHVLRPRRGDAGPADSSAVGGALGPAVAAFRGHPGI